MASTSISFDMNPSHAETRHEPSSQAHAHQDTYSDYCVEYVSDKRCQREKMANYGVYFIRDMPSINWAAPNTLAFLHTPSLINQKHNQLNVWPC